jgi:hypothetical protein
MAVSSELLCPQCGRSLGTIQWTFRKAGGAIAFSCPDCANIVDASELAVEWGLLSPAEKTLRVIITGLLSIGTGVGIALLVAIFGWMLGSSIGWFKGESLPIRSPYFLGTVGGLGLVMTVSYFIHLMSDDISGSRRRLADPKYRKLLVRLDFLQSS